jgi:hypothetical protein
MPDITIPNTFVDGASADAEQVMENAYLPKLIPDNLEVINGRLTNPNRDGWSIASSDVRQGHFSQAEQVSATANQDYFDDFLTMASTGTIGDFQYQAMAIPGCSISFYVPWQVTAVELNWHLSIITDAFKTVPLYPDQGGTRNFQGNTWLMLFIDGYPVPQITRKMKDGNHTMAYDSASPGTYNNYYQIPDTRHWSGSFLYDSSLGSTIIPPGNLNYIERGWHTASIRIAFPPLNRTALLNTPIPGSGIQQARVKTRRMSYTLIR